MNKFLTSNETKYRLLRTIAQGIIGVFIANVDILVDGMTIPTPYKPMIVALVMAILSPIMSELGGASTDSTYNEDDMEDEWGDEPEPFDEIGIPATDEEGDE